MEGIKNKLSTLELESLLKETGSYSQYEEIDFCILYGKTGIGKTDIVKQYLSKIEGNKLYIQGFIDFDLKNTLMGLDNFTIVFDEILSLDGISNLAEIIKNKKGSLIVFITRDESQLKKISQYVQEFLQIDPENYIEYEITADFLASMEYISSKSSYWGENEISNIVLK